MRSSTSRRTAALGAGAAAMTAGLIASPVLMASAAGTATTYNACVDAKTGTLYSVKAGTAAACKTGDAPISWNSQGPTGATGASAYQTWLASGRTGTEQDFLAALRGAQGPAGRDGLNGLNGLNGRDGAAGANGANGANGSNGLNGHDGKDAYLSWLALGGQGSEADFLASLQGPQGDPGQDGAPGATGPKGDKGDKGDAGAGLPEVWAMTGYAQIETQDQKVAPLWLDVPAGVYQVQAKLTPMLYVADVPGHDILRAHCTLDFSSTVNGTTTKGTLDRADVQLPVVSDEGSMEVTLSLQSFSFYASNAPAHYTVSCTGDAKVKLIDAAIAATRVTYGH